MRMDVRRVNGAIRLDLVARTDHERALLKAFVEALNGGPMTSSDNPVLDIAIRVESVGFADDGAIDSIAIEGPPCD